MTIASKLQLTLDNKNAIKLALQNKGSSPTDVFSTYAGLIDELATSGVATPQIIAPINGATGVAQSPIITASRFSGLDADGFADVHVASVWTFASDSGFTDILHTSGRDTENLESYDCASEGVTFEGITVYVRVEYEGASGNKAQSAGTMFEVVDIPGIGEYSGGGYVANYMFDEFGSPYILIVSMKDAGETLSKTNFQSAINYCEGLSAGGFSDWRLPTFDEYVACYWPLKPGTVTNVTSEGASTLIDPPTSNYTSSNPSQTSIETFKDGGNNSFNIDEYWSATEDSSTTAFRFSFNRGERSLAGKSLSGYARAVRRVYL